MTKHALESLRCICRHYIWPKLGTHFGPNFSLAQRRIQFAKYLGWAERQGKVEHHSADTVRAVLDQYEATVSADLDHLDYRLQELTQHSGIEVFAVSEVMLARAIQLSTMNLDLKPFDQAILAAVLVRAEQLRDEGADDVAFCKLDSDLQPWDKNGKTKQPLAALYDSAGVCVYGDFAMESPLRSSSSTS